VAVKARGDISVQPVRGQKIEEHVFTDLDVGNDDNTPSLSSGAVAEERQEVSLKNTIDGLSDTITGGRDIGLWSSNIPEKMWEYWLKNEKLFKVIFKTQCSTTQKRQTPHGNAPQILFVARTTTPKSLKETGFVFLLHKVVFIVSRKLMCAETTKYAHSLLEQKSATGSTLRSHEQSMEHKDVTITFSRRCN